MVIKGMKPDTLLNAALVYADLGYKVFPCRRAAKKPTIPKGFLAGTCDAATVEKYWELNDRWSNIGIATAGLLVVDVDGATNPWPGSYDKSFDLLLAPMAITPRGGRHYVFRRPTGVSWRCSAGKLAEKVDIRTDGGYIVAAPSVIYDSKKAYATPYEWMLDNALDIGPESLPLPPRWLHEMLDGLEGSNGGSSSQRTSKALAANAIPEGQRNHTLFSLAGTMRRVGMGQQEISGALVQTNNLRCVPPISLNELDRIVASVCRYAPDEVMVAIAENHWEQQNANKGEKAWFE